LDIGAIWDVIILQPVTNVLVAMSHYLFGSFGIAIVVITILFNLLLYPMTVRQLKATKATQDMQPKLAELRKKYAKDAQKLAQEQMKLYKESGVSPAGCLLPMLAQTPIWIALYQAIIRVMAVNPESFLNLSPYLYPWPVVYAALPLNQSFLWMNLAAPDMVLALLVGASMWVQQKMTTTVVNDPQMQRQNQTMQIMMPAMFVFLSMTFPSGLALYWVVSNLFRIVVQYFYSGWGGLTDWIDKLPGLLPFLKKKNYTVKPRVVKKDFSGTASPSAASTAVSEVNKNETTRDKRANRGGSNPAGSEGAGGKPGTDRDRRPKRR
jgi:YidC/Oxa1 family membrane protein insertase